MVLQELIRNIVLYRGIINPLLQVVRDYIVTQLILQKVQTHSSIALIQPQHESIAALVSLTGTHTSSIIVDFKVHHQATSAGILNGDSSILTIMLMGSGLFNWIDKIAKTHLNSSIVFLSKSIPTLVVTGSLTTGSYLEKSYLYLSHETHERRECLGEFSLPHEEIQRKSLSERR